MLAFDVFRQPRAGRSRRGGRRMFRRIGLGSATGVALVLFIAAEASASVSWTPVKPVGAVGTFAYYGGHLATTLKRSTRYLHQVMTQDKFNGTYASDSGTHEAVVYQRLTATGGKSGAPLRLNKTTEHGNSTSIVSAGTNVYTV